MAGKSKKPETKTQVKGKGPDVSGVKLDDAGRYKVKDGEISDELLGDVSGGLKNNILVASACKPSTPPPKTPLYGGCKCPSIKGICTVQK